MTLSRDAAMGLLALGLALALVGLGWERLRPPPLKSRLDVEPERRVEWGRPRR